MLTKSIRGTVVGFGQRAPNNKNALTISFGGFSYATALARVFSRVSAITMYTIDKHMHMQCAHTNACTQVASLNFSPNYNSSDEIGTITQYMTFIVSLVFPDNILSGRTSNVNKVRVHVIS